MQTREAEISMVLNTFMYLDYKDAAEGESLRQIVADLAEHPDYGGGGIHYGEYTVLKQAVETKEIGELTISRQSINMGYDSGTAACTFSVPGGETVYVVYRGTGDGEWPDNGLGMTQTATVQQNRALEYFEEVVDDMGLTKAQTVIVTGHSKGGNKAQFVTMETKYEEIVDVCYSVDGQGFSDAAIKNWQGAYTKEGFDARRTKIYGIHGENDYVSVLGNSIIKKEHITYVKTPVNKGDFVGYHDIKYMFSTLEYDKDKGEYVNVFHGRSNSRALEKGKLGTYAENLSDRLMHLPAEQRDGSAAVIMQLMEMTRGSHSGMNGEKITLEDVGEFLWYGVPIIAESLLQEEGRELLSFLGKGSGTGIYTGLAVELNVDTDKLIQTGEQQIQSATAVSLLAGQVVEAAEQVPGYIRGGTAIYHQLKLSAARIECLGERIKQLGAQKGEIAQRYQSAEILSLEEIQRMIDFSCSIL